VQSPEIKKIRLLKGLGRNVIVLGLVSFFTDISSEMLYPIIPLFLTTVLHAPMSVVGLIEGVAESTASLLKVASGWFSDRIGRRKPFVIFGYSLSSVTKPFLALAGLWNAWVVVLIARFLDRAGKGSRGPARDALIAASCDEENRGKAFGLHRAMDTAGAVIGPLAALFFLWFFAKKSIALKNSYMLVFLISFIPAVTAVFLLVAFAREKKTEAPGSGRFSFKNSSLISKPFYRFLVIYAVFCIGNSSDIFLLLKAKNSGFTSAHVILAYVLYNVVYAILSVPAGWLSDRVGRVKVLTFGLLAFAGVYLGFALLGKEDSAWIWLLFALYGVYTASTEGVTKALVADTCAAEVRGTAMGLLQGVVGILALFASVIAGILWDTVGPAAPFYFGAFFAGISAILLMLFQRKRE